MSHLHIAFGLCGSFCTLARAFSVMESLTASYTVTPVFSDTVYQTDTRFGTAQSWIDRATALCGKPPLHTIPEAEPLGPKIHPDLLLLLPCTGNTLAKIACGITDTPVTMAAKAQLRSNRPVLIGLASNDALSANLSNIASLLNRKNVFFVPLSQDDPVAKPHSLICRFDRVVPAVDAALQAQQLQPIFG